MAAKAKKKAARKKTAKRRATGGSRRAASAGRGLQLQSAEPSFTVNDVEKSLAWYRDVLGFTVGEHWVREGQLGGVELVAGEVHFWLAQDDWKKGRDRAKGEGFRLYCATRQDVDKLAERIRSAGGTLLEEPHDEPWGGRALAVADPDGFKITVARG